MRKLETHDWWPQVLSLKDELSLRELGEKFDVTPGALSKAFMRTGVTRKPAPPGPRSRRSGDDGAGASTAKDAVLEPLMSKLGTVPDSEIAKEAGVAARTVAAFRARHGIAGFKGSGKKKKGRRRLKLDPFRDIIGNVPDRVVAEKAGVSINTVRNYRARFDIKPAGRGRPTNEMIEAAQEIVDGGIPPEKGTSAPKVHRASAPASGGTAWLVTYDAGEGVVLASSLLEAAHKAAELRIELEVRAISYVGEML